MIDNYAKLILKVWLIGKTKVRIEVSNVHEKIKYFDAVILAEHKTINFSILKSNYCNLTPGWFTIPIDPKKPETKNWCEYIYDSEIERYNNLNKIRETLMEYSKSKVFYNTGQKKEEPYIVFKDEFWFIY